MIDGFTLLFAALLLLAGNLSDRVGAKKALRLGIVVFGLACAAAVMLPASMALVREAFSDPRRRVRALGSGRSEEPSPGWSVSPWAAC